MEYSVVVLIVVLLVGASVLFRRTKQYRRLKDDAKYFEAVILFVTLLITFGSGVYGFETSNNPAFADYSKADVIFNIITMLALNYSDPVGADVMLNVSRFSAAFFTLGAVVLLLDKFFNYIHNIIIGLSKKSVLIFGNNDITERLVDNMWPYGIAAGNRYINVRGSVFLLGEDNENIQFFADNVKKLSKKQVFIRNKNVPGLMLNYSENEENEAFVKMFSFDELAAHIYWEKHPLINNPENIEEAKHILDSRYNIKVAVIGDDTIVDELLLFGTQYNVINEESVVEFHIFKGSREFAAVHTNLDKLNIIYHDTEWYEYEYFDSIERVIITQQKNQNRMIHELFLMNPAIKIHIFSPFSVETKEQVSKAYMDDRGGMILGNDSLVMFYWISEICAEGVIASDERIKAAKTLNYYYNHRKEINALSELPQPKEDDMEKAQDSDRNKIITCAEDLMDREWAAISSYHRYSNMFAADNVRKYYKVCEGLFADEVYREKMRRLEHIRWNNYNYFFNWQKADGDNRRKMVVGKVTKDWQKRLHMDLVPYERLNGEEADKDNIIKWLILYKEYEGEKNDAI